ncbi:MAG TPA: LysR family transcriptional regulator [Woeseiaceae bacterium]|nr:LysR family transcriptional regulator [Woeseiaceae bacterium]
MNSKTTLRDWGDIRLFLAIVEHGSLLAASEHLSVSQPTLGRRLAAMEKRMGVPLFVRTGRRMQLTDTGRSILENAQRMEREMLAIERAVDVQSKGLAGEVVITATEGTGTEWLPPELTEFRRRYPDITLNIRVDSRTMDLLRREADIALRLGEPKEPELIGRRLVTVGFGLYAAPSYLKHAPPLESLDDLAHHDLIGLEQAGSQAHLVPGDDLAHLPTGRFVFTTNSAAAQMSAARAGYGIAVLSHRWVAMQGGLVPLLPETNLFEAPMWLLTHEELRHSARIRAVSDFLTERVLANKEQFEGGKAA